MEVPTEEEVDTALTDCAFALKPQYNEVVAKGIIATIQGRLDYFKTEVTRLKEEANDFDHTEGPMGPGGE